MNDMNMEFKDPFEHIASRRPLIMAGPCSAETREQTLNCALRLSEGGIRIYRAGIWKPRTHPGGFEGIGKVGLDWLREVKEKTGMMTATEVATREHVAEALKAGVDILWIGARTTANPFAVQEIAEAVASISPETPVLVKNPVNPDLELWIGALERLYKAGVTRLGAIHRGFSTYGENRYRNAPVWQIPTDLRVRFPSLKILHDPSHTGGDANLIESLSRRAMRMGFDGLIIESHPDPSAAWSDARQQITPETLLDLLPRLPHSSDPARTPADKLGELRGQIDSIDHRLLELLGERMQISRRIGEIKGENGIPVVQPQRFANLLDDRTERGAELGLSPEFVRRMMKAIHYESVDQQLPPRIQPSDAPTQFKDTFPGTEQTKTHNQ